MICNDFQEKVSLYVDGMLHAPEARAAGDHIARCTTCEALVSSYQQARALLKTAVTDRVAAVDVSGLWESIEAELDGELAPAAESSWLDLVRSWWGERPSLLPDFEPMRVGAWAAAAAAVAVVVSMALPGPQQVATPERVALAPPTPVATESVRRVRSTKEPSVRIDRLEVAEGHTVRTWTRPRTNTRVIWISENDGFGVAPASHLR